MKIVILIFLFLTACSPPEEILRQIEPKKTEKKDFFIDPEDPYEKIDDEKYFDTSWMHPRYKTVISYRSYCYPFSVPFKIVEEILVFAFKNTGLIDNSLNFEDFVEDSQTLDINYENKNWVLVYTDSKTQVTGVADVTLIKSDKCFYSIHLISGQRIYRSEKSVLENFIHNFKP